MTVPAAAVAGNRDLLVPYNFTIAPNPGVITLSGPPITASSEAYMRDTVLNRTILVTLEGDEWDPAIMGGRAMRSLLAADDSPEPALTRSLISGLSSAQNEHGGFDAVLQLNRSAVRVRVPSPTELEIDLPPMEAFDILRPETLSLAVPPAAVKSRSVPLLAQDWIILPSVGIPSLRDNSEPDAPPLESVRELALQVNGTTIFFHILSDSFTPQVGGDSLESVLIVDSITSQQNEEHGWNAIVRRSLDYRALQRISDNVIAFIIPPMGRSGYDVLAPVRDGPNPASLHQALPDADASQDTRCDRLSRHPSQSLYPCCLVLQLPDQKMHACVPRRR